MIIYVGAECLQVKTFTGMVSTDENKKRKYLTLCLEKRTMPL